MSFLERARHWGMTKREWKMFRTSIDAELYSERASKQFGLDLASDLTVATTDVLRSRLDDAEDIGLDRELVYMMWVHGSIMGPGGHAECCSWYKKPDVKSVLPNHHVLLSSLL